MKKMVVMIGNKMSKDNPLIELKKNKVLVTEKNYF